MATAIRPANRQLMRAINESIVLGLIRRNGPISRVAIARAAHLSAATVTGITTSLIEQGLVFEEAPGVSTGGRRPILLSFERQAGAALGIKITESELVCVTTDLLGAMEERSSIALAPSATPEAVVALIAAEAARVRDARAPRWLAGIGVGIAGVVDRPSGVSRLSPFLHWENVPLRSMLEAAAGVPTVVENDVDTLAFAFRDEIVRPDSNTFLVVTLGRGVGFGMILNHQPFRGARGQGGEFGHITMESGGPRCECGKRGCLEAIASVPAILREASRMLDRPVPETELKELVLAGNATLLPLTNRVADTLGHALATLVNLLNPDAIVLSGEAAWLADHLLGRIERSMSAEIFGGLSSELDMRVEMRGDEFWAAGAAGLLLEETFRPHRGRVQEGWG